MDGSLSSSILHHIRSKSLYQLKSFGDSMKPVLFDGDSVFIKKIDVKKLKEDDIITFQRRGKFVTHRVTYIRKNTLYTQGDNSALSDGEVNPGDIVGKVIEVKRRNKNFPIELINLAQSNVYYSEIIRITSAFEKYSVDYVILKGLPLNLYYEKSVPRRFYADCDILVSTKQNLKVDKIFTKNGFKKYENPLGKTRRRKKIHYAECSYSKVIRGISVVFDVHLSAFILINQTRNTHDLYDKNLQTNLNQKFLSHRRKIVIGENSLYILSPIHLLIYLSLHFFSRHNCKGIFRLRQIASISLKENILKDTSRRKEIITTIIKYKLQNYIYPVFIFMERYYGIKIPRSFLTNLRPGWFARWYIDRFIKENDRFENQTRIAAGIERFRNIFFLSPQPFYLRIRIFLRREILQLIFCSVFGN